MAVLKESCAIEAVYHNPSAPGLASDLEGIKQVFTMFRTTSPDIRLTIEDMIAEGNELVSRLTMRGIHKDEPVSIPPTGKQAMVAAIDVHRISGGKLVENCGVFDELEMMQQLGIAPPRRGRSGGKSVTASFHSMDQEMDQCWFWSYGIQDRTDGYKWVR